ncbi:hypothetical protein MMC30_003004 [Trapelia coarctata]|nr:hypothetical protein [Trapelia coarctata]
MILRRSTPPLPTIIAFAVISSVIGILSVAVGMCYFSRRKQKAWRGERLRERLREDAREESTAPRSVHVDSSETTREDNSIKNASVDSTPSHINSLPYHIRSLPPHMSLGHPAGWIGERVPRVQDGYQGSQTPLGQKSMESSRLEGAPRQGQLRTPTPMGFRYEEYRSGTPPVHLKPNTTSTANSTATSSRKTTSNAPLAQPRPILVPPTANIPRTTTPKPLPALIPTTPSRSNTDMNPSRSGTPTPFPRGTNRNNPFTLAVIPASPLVFDTRPSPVEESSSGSEYSQPSDPGPSAPGPSAFAERQMAARLKALEPRGPEPSVLFGSPNPRVASPPTRFGSPQARIASPPARTLPSAISVPAQARTKVHSLHAHFTPVKEDAPPLPLPPLPALGAADAGGPRHLGVHPALRPSSSEYSLNPGKGTALEGLTDPQKAFFPPNLNLSPLGMLEAKLVHGQNMQNTQHHQLQHEGLGIGAEGISNTDESTTSTSHGEATNVAFANTLANKTWAQRCAEDGRFRNKFEALVASEVSDEGMGMANPQPHTPYGVPGILRSRERFGSTLQIPSPLRNKKNGAYY